MIQVALIEQSAAIDRAAERIERTIRETGERMAKTLGASIIANGTIQVNTEGCWPWEQSAENFWHATAPKDSQ